MISESTVKTIDSNGQVFFGEEFAGRKVYIDSLEAGVWLIRSTDIISQNERWIHEPQVQKDLEEAMAWAIKNGASSNNTEDILRRLENEIKND